MCEHTLQNFETWGLSIGVFSQIFPSNFCLHHMTCLGLGMETLETRHWASAFNKCNKKSRICTCPSSFDTRLGKWVSANYKPCRLIPCAKKYLMDYYY